MTFFIKKKDFSTLDEIIAKINTVEDTYNVRLAFVSTVQEYWKLVFKS